MALACVSVPAITFQASNAFNGIIKIPSRKIKIQVLITAPVFVSKHDAFGIFHLQRVQLLRRR